MIVRSVGDWLLPIPLNWVVKVTRMLSVDTVLLFFVKSVFDLLLVTGIPIELFLSAVVFAFLLSIV